MPKLLDVIKEKNMTHAEAIELIEKNYVKPEGEIEEPEEPIIEEEEIDKPEDEPVKPKDEEEAELIQKLADEEEAKIEAKAKSDKVKIAEMVQDELKKRGKVKRKKPSAGTLTDVPKLDYDINTTGYEVKTTRRVKK